MKSVFLYTLLSVGLVSARVLDTRGLQRRVDIKHQDIKDHNGATVGHAFHATYNPGKKLTPQELVEHSKAAHQAAQNHPEAKAHDHNSMQMATMQLKDHTVIHASKPHPVSGKTDEMGKAMWDKSHPAHVADLKDRNKDKGSRAGIDKQKTAGGEFHAEDHLYQKVHEHDGGKHLDQHGQLHPDNLGVVTGHTSKEHKNDPKVIPNCGAPGQPSHIGKELPCSGMAEHRNANWINDKDASHAGDKRPPPSRTPSGEPPKKKPSKL